MRVGTAIVVSVPAFITREYPHVCGVYTPEQTAEVVLRGVSQFT